MRLPDPESSRAVLIGVSRYDSDGFPDVPAVKNNVSALADILMNPSLCGLPRANCISVPDPSSPALLYKTLLDAATSALDTLIFYFSGHGATGGNYNEL
ncbi:caspase family protein [Actinoplanes friuliensis]|uniref:caspase family protein n=1 Tax=Actinoplanes friuliensis TaxID=196914 RepID=UPI0011DE13BA|nr:caspase family protein [Actinoplanes friuliensis]